MTNLDRIFKRRHYFAKKVQYNQSYDFSSCHVWMWHLAHKEWWAMKNWWFWAVVLDKTLVSPLDCKEIQPVNSKGNQSWIIIGRTDAEAEAPILWPTDVKNWLIRKDPVVLKDWRQKKRTIEDEMVGWHHRLDGREFEVASGVCEGQEGLSCCIPKRQTWLSNWSELQFTCYLLFVHLLFE